MATFQTGTHGAHATFNAYLFFQCILLMHIINRMLILQLKIFLSVNLCLHFDSLYNLAFIFSFRCCGCSYNQMFTIFIAATPTTYVRLLKIGYEMRH